MAAQPGISTTSDPPNAVVQVQPGMNVQPVVLVDQNGQYVTASTATALATTTTPVNVSAATAPTTGQVLTATSGTAATWQAGAGLPLTTLGDIVYENSTPAPARLAGNTTATKNFLTQTGTGAVSAAPAWGVIASADLPAGTTSAQGALQLDGTGGDIQPTGTVASAGNKGQAADAKHVHVQNYAGLFGDGSDGTATLDGTATVTWASKASSTYTMTRDAFCTSLTVSSGSTLVTHGFRIFCTGTFSSAGTVSSTGSNASGATGASGALGGTLGAGGNGATATTAAGTTPAFSSGASAGTGSGGAGGTGTAGAGGAARAPFFATAFPFRVPSTALAGMLTASSGASTPAGGPGGSSGAGDSSNTGGGGGGGGGLIVVFAPSASNTGTINVAGGNGFTAATGNCGGGGGGAGGNIIVYTLDAWTAGTTNVAGGSHGNGVGSGTNGGDGTSGTVLNVVLS